VSLDLVTEFDFSTPGDYTTGGSCEISGGALQLEDSFHMLNDNIRKWGEPMGTVEDPESPHYLDMYPLNGTLHKAMDGESPPSQLGLVDGVFVFWAYPTTLQAAGSLQVRSRLDGSDYIQHVLYHQSSSQLVFQLKRSDGATVMWDLAFMFDWPINTWREVLLLTLDDDIYFRAGAQRDYGYRHLGLTDAGTWAFYLSDATEPWYIGSNDGSPSHPSAKPCPFTCERKYGTCELNEGSAWTAPDNITSLNWMAWHTEPAWTPTHTDAASRPLFREVIENFQYNHFNGSAWTGWLDLPAHGDMSGVSVSAGDKLRWRFNDGSGYGLDNGEDPRWQSQIKRVLLSYTVDGELATDAPTAHRRNAVKAGPRKGAFN